MKIPVITGIIARRILVNFQVDPGILERLLPPPFRPELIRGRGIAGICLIRLEEIRPRGLPALLGTSSENAAHRITVKWDECGRRREGVYIPRRDTSSRLNAFLGSRIFPGIHHLGRFEAREDRDSVRVAFASGDGGASAVIEGRAAGRIPAGSVFRSIEEATEFFRRGSVGYSPAAAPGRLDGMELRCLEWRIEPLEVERVLSSFFEDGRLFPPGSARFDSAFRMRWIRHEWHARAPLESSERVETGMEVMACDREE